ncbi:probable myosin-binding protein 4 [Brachypodium distachyon]|uniref:probable myosin-binding protein 4 n=1 Tax=Brachypodium distachyon TaxID=15368 RepID=UPI000D0D32FF|nr:probable myosin-binding protein 4 [Brachypodium distachyon]|eukprot:XP_024314972.1 probable myosin-binding protein 4 [Brachypodium distachyon]
MAVKARARSREFSRQFWSVLRHALSECFLIVMLLVVAVVSYTATKFAHICRIRSPCMLCSRLDQVLHGKAWFSEESICAAHRLEIVKPGNLKNMSVKEKVNSRLRFRHTELCSCCSKPFKKKRDAHRLSEEVSDMFLDDSMSKVKERSIAMASVGCSSDDDVDQLPHGCYRKLSADHDSESEIRISDDDDGCLAMVYEAKQRTRDKPCADAWLQPMITSTNTLSPSPSESTDQTKFMSITPLVPLDTAEGTTNAAKSSDPAIGDGLEEINWGQPNVSNNNLDVQLNTVPEQDCQELQKEKTFLVGIEELNDSESVSGSPDEEATKIFATSAYDGTSSTADPRIDCNNSIKNTNSRTQEEDIPVPQEKIECPLQRVEAERSASAVAASEAMAMINRLQQDKAAMHMEAMQYLRMMEEQADHDQEAIEKLNDLLTEREKEILDLEAELDNYQIKYSDESFDVRKFDATDGDVAFEALDS